MRRRWGARAFPTSQHKGKNMGRVYNRRNPHLQSLLAGSLDLSLRNDLLRPRRLGRPPSALLWPTPSPLHLDRVSIDLDADAALRRGKFGRVAVDKVDERDLAARDEDDALQLAFRNAARRREPMSDRILGCGYRQGGQEQGGLQGGRKSATGPASPGRRGTHDVGICGRSESALAGVLAEDLARDRVVRAVVCRDRRPATVSIPYLGTALQRLETHSDP